MREKLTERVLERLRTPARGQRVNVYDTVCRGLVASKFSSGRIGFSIDYGGRGRRQWFAFGSLKPHGELTLDDARAKAGELLRVARAGGDPKADRRRERSEPTFSAWTGAPLKADQEPAKGTYLATVKGLKRSWKDDRRYLGRAAARWGSRRLSKITTEEVRRAFEDEVARRGKISGNRWLASVRAAFSSAWREGAVPENVAARVRFLPENPPRSRVLSEDELRRVYKALGKVRDPFTRGALVLVLATGCRKSEALRARWEDFDLAARPPLWRIPASKSGRPASIPVSSEVVKMLRALPRLEGCPWLFPGRGTGGHLADIRKQWSSLCKRAKVEGVTVHDCRRSFGLAVARSAGVHVASRLLRHSRIQTTVAIYSPLGAVELGKATERVARDRAALLPERERAAAERVARKRGKRAAGKVRGELLAAGGRFAGKRRGAKGAAS